MKNLRYIKDLLIKYRFRYLAGILCLLAVDVLQLVLPMVLGAITDLIKDGSLERSSLAKYVFYIIVIAVGIAVFRFLWRYLVLGVSRLIEEQLRNRFYSHIQILSADYFNTHKTGDLMAHATNDINSVTMASGHGIVVVVDSIVIPVVALIMMFGTVGLRLTLAAFSPLLGLAIIIGFFAKEMQVRIRKIHESFSDLTETARENFSGIRVVKSYAQEFEEIRKFEKSNKFNKQNNLNYVRLTSMLSPTVMSVSAISFAIALWYGGIEVINGHITLGDFVAFNSYLGMLIWPIAALGWVVNVMERGAVSLKRINEILDEQPEICDVEKTACISHIEGRIVFKNLTFSYPGSKRSALRNINITLEKGKTLAIVGRTGSGKTTLVNLIPRLFNVDNGMLFIDDVDINQISLQVLRSSIGYVPQDTFLFSSTIRENIDFYRGKPEEIIVEAAKCAGVYDNIMSFPYQFDTAVGERGITLSGGQKQRIAIARAIIGSPAILILDDCLSAVDTHTEEQILRELKHIMSERTSIIVSHRISTIKDADEIIVLEDGEIVERGTHESLLGQCGFYYSLYQKQLLAEQIEEVE
jgi:ATP-binding cassette subfamily B multidrug efflux pump